MSSQLRKILEEHGLSEKQASVYLALLKLGESRPSEVARHARLKRPITYVVLDELVKLGLASHVRQQKALHFRPVNVYAFLEQQQDKLQRLKLAVPELSALAGAGGSKPQMTVFEGPDGLREIMEDSLTAKDEILFWGNMQLITTSVFRDYWPIYIRKRVAKRIWARGLLSDDPVSREFQQRGRAELREVYLIPQAKYPFRNEVNIYNDRISIISHEDLAGLIIQNRTIADSQRSIFRFAFDCAKARDRR